MNRCWRMIFWLWWMVFGFGGMIDRLRWMIFWLRRVVCRFWIVISGMYTKNFFQCCPVSWFCVARCWVVVDFHRLVGRFSWLHIVINGMVKMVSVVHHVCHMWIFLHVVHWHSNPENGF